MRNELLRRYHIELVYEGEIAMKINKNGNIWMGGVHESL
jgi:hypothetical protein